MNFVPCVECGLVIDIIDGVNHAVCAGGFAHISCPDGDWCRRALGRLQWAWLEGKAETILTMSVRYDPDQIEL